MRLRQRSTRSGPVVEVLSNLACRTIPSGGHLTPFTLRMHRNRLLILVAGALVAGVSTATAQALDSLTAAGMRWRTVGPGNFEGRVTDIAAIPGSATFLVSAAAGGVFKTTNGGITFRPTFDTYPCASTGAITIAPSDTNIVYLGTG